MSNRWRPSYGPEYKKKLQEFLDRHDELPFDEPKEFMKYCTDNMIMDVETGEQRKDNIADKLRELTEEIEN